MPYAVVVWRRGENFIDITGIKPDDHTYLERIPCLATRKQIDAEGFIRFGPIEIEHPRMKEMKPAVVLTALEVIGFKVVTSTAVSVPTSTGHCTEYSWTLRRDFSVPEPQSA